ncbi:MAG: ABC-F family ATP-binding cassette domain-containing protein [Lachnospiraceae bacterium]|nr:ATP-binding cassette domain-containing protein [Lachnospiraceae bacterium]MDD7702160.1 ABC-F family ATP-binding cassette domain-containing protein [Lachnospiraceae bacterium]
MLLEISDGTVSRGGHTVLKNFDFYIKGRERIAIVGRNGAGKTTLLELLAGELRLDRDDKTRGAGLRMSRDLTVRFLSQEMALPLDMSLDEYVLSTFREGDLHSKERYAYDSSFNRILTGFGLEIRDRKKMLKEFSGGEQKKIAMIRLLLEEPDILLLDEPTNHLDFQTVEWLEDYLLDYPKTVVMVSHDRFFIDRTAEVIWEISNGRLTRYVGSYTSYRKEKRENAKRQWKAYEAQEEEIKRLSDLVQRFKHKPTKASFARSRLKMIERMERIEKPESEEAYIHSSKIEPDQLGAKWPYQCEELRIGYGEEAIRTITLRLRRGQKLGVIGPNGSGKSTFLKTVAGIIPALKGKGSLGNHIDLAYFDQMSGELDSELSVFEYYHDAFPSLREKEVRTQLASYLFRGDALGKCVASLSGGEKARLALAVLLSRKPNFLILDEPTNNMDIPAKETMESIFRMYSGTILMVSHDRYFLSEVCDSLLIFEEDKEDASFYPFSYRHYVDRLKQGDGEVAHSLMRSMEEQKLIEGLKAVPKAERFRLREYSTVEANRDWRYEQNRERRHAAEEKLLQAELETEAEKETRKDAYMSLDDWLYGDDAEPSMGEAGQREEQRRAEAELTKELIDWYDIWLETHPDGEE